MEFFSSSSFDNLNTHLYSYYPFCSTTQCIPHHEFDSRFQIISFFQFVFYILDLILNYDTNSDFFLFLHLKLLCKMNLILLNMTVHFFFVVLFSLLCYAKLSKVFQLKFYQFFHLNIYKCSYDNI